MCAFTINGQPTYAGRTYRGWPIEGLLMNVRAVQATFDDINPETRDQWAYPDTGVWDPERNLSEFLAVLPGVARGGAAGVHRQLPGRLTGGVQPHAAVGELRLRRLTARCGRLTWTG